MTSVIVMTINTYYLIRFVVCNMYAPQPIKFDFVPTFKKKMITKPYKRKSAPRRKFLNNLPMTIIIVSGMIVALN